MWTLEFETNIFMFQISIICYNSKLNKTRTCGSDMGRSQKNGLKWQKPEKSLENQEMVI